MKVAVVTLPILLASVLYLTNHQTAEEQDHFTQQMIVKEIPRGQKLTIYLPDGSRVKLNAESRISYPKPFDEDQRVVTLDGEAFFEVTPNPAKPFLVLSEGIETRVVGTSFNVNAYPDDDLVEISVVTGEVAIKRISDQEQNVRPLALLPTEQATYSIEKGEAVVSGFDPNKVLGWKEGTLYFNNASMDEFVAELERWYGIEIVVARKMPIKKGIVGEFRNQSLEEILIGLHSASEFEYEFVKGKLIIK
jgi:ferric-dicitrate binding protein FerR (iron transport regulator)